MAFFDFLKKKKRENPEASRRRHLERSRRDSRRRANRTFVDNRGREIAFYTYTLNGVDFESSEILSEEQRRDPLKYAPGAKVGIRYDPKNQGNSMLD